MSTPEIDFPCVGVCLVDASGYCQGCGRPPASLPPSVPAYDDTRSAAVSADWRSATELRSSGIAD